MRPHVATNVPDQRPGASDAWIGTEMRSRGSLRPFSLGHLSTAVVILICQLRVKLCDLILVPRLARWLGWMSLITWKPLTASKLCLDRGEYGYLSAHPMTNTAMANGKRRFMEANDQLTDRRPSEASEVLAGVLGGGSVQRRVR